MYVTMQVNNKVTHMLYSLQSQLVTCTIWFSTGPGRSPAGYARDGLDSTLLSTLWTDVGRAAECKSDGWPRLLCCANRSYVEPVCGQGPAVL